MTIIVLFLPTGSGEKIENTMEAFTQWVSLLLYLLPLFLPPSYYLLISSCDSAVSAGTEMLEMDCHLTSDGYVVISHDSNLKRQTGYDQTVSSLRFQVVILTVNFLFIFLWFVMIFESYFVCFRTCLSMKSDSRSHFMLVSTLIRFYTFQLYIIKHFSEALITKICHMYCYHVLGHYSTGKDRQFVLLEDLFKKFPSMPMILEIKENNDLLIKKVRSSCFFFFLQFAIFLLPAVIKFILLIKCVSESQCFSGLWLGLKIYIIFYAFPIF